MRNNLLVAGGAAILLALLVWWFTSGPHLIIALETTDGKSNLTYSCAITTDAAEAEGRANAAHLAFQSRLKIIAEVSAAKMNAALESRDTSGSETNAIYTSYKADAAALIANLEDEFGCEVSGLY